MNYEPMMLPSAGAKTGLIIELALRGAMFEPQVREIAIALVRGLGREDHAGRIQRLHEFVRDSIDYVREPIEMLHTPTTTLQLGAGDCDDHVILLGALAWALKYPFAVRPIGDPENPHHYSIAIGWPPSEVPAGDDSTTWVHAETSIMALTGESTEAAEARLFR